MIFAGILSTIFPLFMSMFGIRILIAQVYYGFVYDESRLIIDILFTLVCCFVTIGQIGLIAYRIKK